ncbi:cytochrome c oxidase assembly protein COX15 isoform X2 [Panicum miliaceum]|uniref:Cytochrome c oxidase assembly protein COX15 isoform X2 n=1 Tax=Panicum miliaceum TaxID=4540 RepID=A0A3L6SXM9_PANMI|nr:cytochrome c oxidase assembly protein COX15 isoform X2 [Panicum miliaceum]
MAVGVWLFGCASWVFSLVVLGGITRLTRSGLSMTDWKFTGEIPPMSDEAWLVEFEKYKQSPEYMRVNKGMSLEDFKFIYWMEYAHRMWGRALGFVFAGPFAYFIAKGYVTRQLGLRLSALFALGGAQGLIGWWMVKSGLELNHRILATATLLSVGGLWLAARKIDMHPAVKSLIGTTLGMASLQVTLGISTLLMYVPTSLGSAHQAGALTLLALMILLTHTLRRPSPALLKSLATAVKST